MREYGRVHSTFWSSKTIAALTEDGRTLALYLMTCQHATIAGVFRLPDGYAAEDLRWSSERVREGFADLDRNGFATRCEASKWVWVRKHFEWNPPENPNQAKAAAKCAAMIPADCDWKRAFMRASGQLLGFGDCENEPEEHNGCATLSEPFRNQEQEQEQEKEQKQEEKAARKRAATPDRPDDVAEQVWDDWLALRKAKRAPVTDTVIREARAEAAKAGMTLEAFLREWCSRGSQGLKAEWLERDRRNAPRSLAEPAWRTEKRELMRAYAGPAAAKPATEVFDVAARIVG